MYKKEKSQALIISLWILAILTILAISIGRQVSMALYLSKYQKNRLKAISLAKAGINRAIVELEEDSTPNYDALNETWNTGSDSTGKSLFENVEIEQGSGETFTLTIIDEERKININKIDDFGKEQLVALFRFAGLGETEAGDLKNIIVAWIDPTPETEPGREIFRNGPLGISEELLLILEYFYEPKVGVDNYRKKAQEVYDKVKDLITVYTDGKVNINTASPDVLTILAKAIVAKNFPGNPQYEQAANNLASKIIGFRDSEKGPFKTESINDFPEKELTATEDKNIFNEMKIYLTPKSDYFRIESTGNVGQIKKKITAVIKRGTPIETVYWHEN